MLKKVSRLISKINLTDYTELKGWGCKVSKEDLLEFLKVSPKTKHEVFSQSPDCYITTLKGTNTKIATSLDYFYPLVDNPYLQGQITMCNVLSDIYAMGITEIDHVLAVLGLSNKLDKNERIEIAMEITKGMDFKANEADTKISGGQTVINPWVITGGSVLGVVTDFLVDNKNCKDGEVIVLTKPLGNQMVINFEQYYRKNPEFVKKIEDTGLLTEESFKPIFEKGVESMTTLNLYAAKIMGKFKDSIKACTDITGFGIKGHSENLLDIQKNEVDFVFHTFPVFGNLWKLDKLVRNFKLEEGLAAETSGGLMIVMDRNIAEEYRKDLLDSYGLESWVIGDVIKGNRKYSKSKDFTFLEIY